MALRKLVRSNYGGESPVSIKYENLHSFKEGVILLCQSILETRRISHLHGSALFKIPLSNFSLETFMPNFVSLTFPSLQLELKNLKHGSHAIALSKGTIFAKDSNFLQQKNLTSAKKESWCPSITNFQVSSIILTRF